mgnify:CR=1 FL=1
MLLKPLATTVVIPVVQIPLVMMKKNFAATDVKPFMTFSEKMTWRIFMRFKQLLVPLQKKWQESTIIYVLTLLLKNY